MKFLKTNSHKKGGSFEFPPPPTPWRVRGSMIRVDQGDIALRTSICRGGVCEVALSVWTKEALLSGHQYVEVACAR